MQKNIRYYSANQETYVFQDFDEGGAADKPTSQGTDKNHPPASRYGNKSDEYAGRNSQHMSPRNRDEPSPSAMKNTPTKSPGQASKKLLDQRESPKITRKEELPAKRVSFGMKMNSPSGGTEALSRNSYNVNNAISFVTSALGLLAHESLEIIEDADEVEEDELDHINLCEQQSPKLQPARRDDCISPVPI